MPVSTADVFVHKADDVLPIPSPPPLSHSASASSTQPGPFQRSHSSYDIPSPQRAPPPPSETEAPTTATINLEQTENEDGNVAVNAEIQQAPAAVAASAAPPSPAGSPAYTQPIESSSVDPLSPSITEACQQQQQRLSHDHLSADLSDIVPVSSAESTGAPGPTVIEPLTEVTPSFSPEDTPCDAHQVRPPSITSTPSAASSPRIPPHAAQYKRRISKLSGIVGSVSSSYMSSGQYAAAPAERVESAQQWGSETSLPQRFSSPRPPSATSLTGAASRLDSPSQLDNNRQSFLDDGFSNERDQEGDSGLAAALEDTMERVRNMSLRNEQARPASSHASQYHARRRSADGSNSMHSSVGTNSIVSQELEYQPLHYHHAELEQRTARQSVLPRHSSSTSELSYGRADSLSSKSLNQQQRYGQPLRPVSFVYLLQGSYPQAAPGATGEQAQGPTPGALASALGHKKTFEMYLANVKKTNDPATQYEFAVFMINSSLTQNDDFEEIITKHKTDKKSKNNNSDSVSKYELIREAKAILQRLSDRGYPFAQYHLADGYASGFFSKGKPDHGKAFALFIAASKHGHVESGYRAALCYEFGWGTNKDKAKASRFYRQAASKGHPGAMLRLGKACIDGDMGQVNKYREGITWLKRAAESADTQYNSAPYELGLLHETGCGDDVFKDLSYAAQLFTRAAELGHAEAAFRMGDAYEHGKLICPTDPALSIHFYTTASQAGHGPAMMALSAWYMLGSEGLLERDYHEAYEWAKKAAETGYAKAAFAVGYFTETGIGCRRDPLEANVWYVRAAEQGDQRARTRLAAIRRAANAGSASKENQNTKKGNYLKVDNDIMV
ncbi:hypothetical protein KEM56_006730 [Ascosphaera pollenicola]|nr:hypothetical protein KEM56_006730 [Ascosphaera pollenicola]